MGKIESVMKSEIVRLARKELHAACAPLARDVRQMKRTVSHLTKTVAALEKFAAAYRKQAHAEKPEFRATEEEVKVARISGGLIRKLRKRMGISQAELASLVGASSVSVGLWETGRTRPRDDKKAAIVALRKLGRREVKGILARKSDATLKRTEIPTSSAKRIQDLRRRLGLTQAHLGILAGVSDTAVGFWEQGKTNPGKETRPALDALQKLSPKEVGRLLARKTAKRSRK